MKGFDLLMTKSFAATLSRRELKNREWKDTIHGNIFSVLIFDTCKIYNSFIMKEAKGTDLHSEKRTRCCRHL